MGGAGIEEVADNVAVEAPLEVRLNGEPFSVIMRTPGADEALAAGFLFSEGVVRSREDIAGMSPGSSGEWIDVTLAPDQTLDFDSLQPPGRIIRLEQRPC